MIYVNLPAQVSIDKIIDDATLLYQEGKYNEAVVVFKEGLKKDATSCKLLTGLANTYVYLDKHTEADSLFVLGMRVAKTKYGDSSLEYAEVLNNYAKLLLLRTDLQKIGPIIDKVISIRKNKLGINSIEYIESAGILGLYYSYIVEFKKADSIFCDTNRHLFEKLDSTDKEYISYIQYPAIYYMLTGNFLQSEKYLLEILSFYETKYGKLHPQYLHVSVGLSTLYAQMDRYYDAALLLEGILPNIKKVVGENHTYTAMALSNLGTSYLSLGYYETAVSCLEESLKASEQIYGKGHMYYFNALNGLALCYEGLGYIEKAESLYLESLELRKAAYGNNHIYVINAMNNLALFYLNLRNTEEAEKIFEKLYLLPEIKTEPYKDMYVNLLNNYSRLLMYKDIDLSYEMIDEALNLFDSTNISDKMFTYLATFSNYIRVLQTMGGISLVTIEELLQMDSDLKKIVYPEHHINYLSSLAELAFFYDQNKKEEEAKAIYDTIFQICNKNEIEASFLNELYPGLIAGYNSREEYSSSEPFMNKLFSIIQKQIGSYSLFMSQLELERYWFHQDATLNYILGFTVNYCSVKPEIGSLTYNVELLKKSLLLNSARKISEAIYTSKDVELMDIWRRYRNQKENLIQLESQKDIDVQQQDDMRISTHNLEKEIVAKSKLFRETKEALDINWQDIQNSLIDNEAAIEFVSYVKQEGWDFKDVFYFAVLLRKNDIYPQIVPLCSRTDFLTVLNKNPDNFKDIYSLIWQPLEKYLSEIERIYLSPDELLHTIPFAGIWDGKDYLVNKYEIINLLSTKYIVDLKQRNTNFTHSPKAVLIGGADFGLSIHEIAQVEKTTNVRNQEELTRGALDRFSLSRGQGYDYLPGSEREIREIGKKLSDLNWDAIILTDKEATESNFKYFSTRDSLKLIHISTHGYYFDPVSREVSLGKTNTNAYRTSDNSLLRSGLLFSGANYVWSGGNLSDKVEDGVLSAYEISNLDLNADLVVLSACNTGLGEIKNSEGVYGLQRAFRLAGAKSLMVSLWEIPDKETVELMDEFYSNWTTGMCKRKAFTNAQRTMCKKYPNNLRKWAGFILIE